ncbi:MAG TPA: Gfo/Idh/MocA family oxidoreductase [Polyangia bacterium]|nr:Gfo/Idh/MocA family oxidoreductase [Polyangia bacterium]
MKLGILGVSHFAMKRMLPAMRTVPGIEVAAIASRELGRASAAAREHGIAKAHGSYEALVADPEIDAIYNPLPNHLHVPWSERAAAAGKHVLCEKPIATTADEARRLLAARDRAGVTVCEATMVRLHPRWLAVRDLLRAGRIGELRAFTGTFGYDLQSRANVRYDAAMGGGVLLDTGFYPVTVSRFCFEAEPTAVVARAARDPETGADVLTSAVLEFPRGHATFSCCMEMAPVQRALLLGTRGHLDVPIAWNPPGARASELVVETSPTLEEPFAERVSFPAADQYARLVDAFARAAAAGDRAGPVPLEDSVKNMAVLEALARSAASGRCEVVAN